MSPRVVAANGKRALCVLAVSLLAFALRPGASHDSGSHDSSSTPVPVWQIALLQTKNASNTEAPSNNCVAVVIAPNYLLAQASCVVQLDSQALEFAEFGLFQSVSRDGENVNMHHESVPIVVITYHPDFDILPQNSTRSSSNSSASKGDGLIEMNDFVILQLEYPPTQAKKVNLLNTTVAWLRSVYEYPNFAVLQVDLDSLELTWLLGDVTLEESTSCGFEANSVQAQDAACVLSPRLWTADQGASTVGNTNKRRPWSLFFHAHQIIRGFMYFLGFASGATAKNPQPFLWPASGVDFIDAPVALSVSWSPGIPNGGGVTGPTLSWLPPHLSFIAGLRFEREGANYCGGSLIGKTYILTAAHCVEGGNVPSWVSVGSLQTSGRDEGEQIRVVNVIQHPEYGSINRANDLALVELE